MAKAVRENLPFMWLAGPQRPVRKFRQD
ncbi:hypothetical protein ACE6ED_04100 [Paenibacillus sp. CN-4]